MAVTLSCMATGDPTPSQSWSRNGTPLSDPRFQVTSNGTVLAVSDVREADQGNYTCHASNLVGFHTAVVYLDVISESHDR